MGATGDTVLDFGAIPVADASVVVTGQAGILATSKVEAFIRLEATADHSVDEHRVEPLKITAGNIVVGVGFTIYGESNLQAYGQWTVTWVWV